jgi:polysaccharide biosynthesis/export protein VpsN
MEHGLMALYKSLMGKFFILSLLCLAAMHVTAQTTVEGGVSSYALGSGDKIKITVFGEDDLSLETMLNDAGSFSYPFIGGLSVKGKTVSELQNMIISGLKGPYLIDPNVNVTIVEYRRFFVNGEVENPGGFAFVPGLSLRKAVSMAGGFTDRASKSKFFIISDSSNSDEPELATLDTSIKPGDIITIEESFF